MIKSNTWECNKIKVKNVVNRFQDKKLKVYLYLANRAEKILCER